jgi:hypothetical protein
MEPNGLSQTSEEREVFRDQAVGASSDVVHLKAFVLKARTMPADGLLDDLH